jgi:FemAB-related protein (PEP-CTERM system-associated)
MLELTKATDLNRKEWEEYIRSRADAHLYFDYRWKTVLEASFGCQSFYLMAREGGRMAGVLPLAFIKSRIMASALISIPFLNYGGILSDDEKTASFLLDKAIEVSGSIGASYIEMRSLSTSKLPLITREHKVTMVLELAGDGDTQWNGLDAKVRNQVRKGQKSGLEVSCGKEELLGQFYGIFALNMRDLGTPVPGKIFFESIFKYFPEESNIFLVKLGNRTVAAAFTLSHKDTMEIPWAGSDRAYYKTCPNEFLYWEAIKGAISRRLKRFDFGRCTKDSGTYRFKKQWGPEIRQLYWQYWAAQESLLPSGAPQKGAFAPMVAVWKRLPMFAANGLGPIIARNLTTF